MRVFALGASRNIGYHAALRKSKHESHLAASLSNIRTVMLARGDTVTYLLRNTKTLEEDEAIKPYIQSGLAVLVKGDATSQEDVQNAWVIASKNGPVDFIVFTIGECVARWLSTSPDLDFRSQANQTPNSTRSKAS